NLDNALKITSGIWLAVCGKVYGLLKILQIGGGQIIFHIIPRQIVVNDRVDLRRNRALSLVWGRL
ncbi:MAG: hypothetical protein K2M15_03590, partial [Oscillospiraceae bacterium]|nr:hypothetical protein [Oscillospiraceae bacterium]